MLRIGPDAVTKSLIGGARRTENLPNRGVAMKEAITFTLTPISAELIRLELDVSPELLQQIFQVCLVGEEPVEPVCVAERSMSRLHRKKRGRPARSTTPLLLERKCVFCTNPFTTSYTGQRYCS